MRDRTPLVLAAVVLALAGIAWAQGGPVLAATGLLQGGRTLLDTLLLLVFAYLTAGLTQALVTREVATRWLGAESGWRGILLACLGGALIPGGPYAYYPIAATIFKAGGGTGVLVAFVTAKNLWSISRLPMEFALLGPKLTLIRFLVTLILPPLLGFLAEPLFGRWIEQTRGEGGI